jgi:hypothetical protein
MNCTTQIALGCLRVAEIAETQGCRAAPHTGYVPRRSRRDPSVLKRRDRARPSDACTRQRYGRSLDLAQIAESVANAVVQSIAMARPGRSGRNTKARSFCQLTRFHHVINTDRVFGTHTQALSAANRAKIFEGNARKVYGRLDSYLDRRNRL